MKKLISCLFYILCLSIIISASNKLYLLTKTKLPPKKVVSLHIVAIHEGMLRFVKNRHELAFVIGHELAHLELGHTQTQEHDLVDEYHSDQLSVYYVLKAGFNPCGGTSLWKRMSERDITLKTTTHPLPESRQKYMKFKYCDIINLPEEKLSIEDAKQIFEDMVKHTKADIKYRVEFFVVDKWTINAYATTIMEDEL